MAGNDRIHEEAKRAFNYLSRQEAMLVTSSYVLVETIALLQNRVSLAAVRDFHVKLQRLLETIWVNLDERGQPYRYSLPAS